MTPQEPPESTPPQKPVESPAKRKNKGFEAMIKPGPPSNELAALIGSPAPLTRGAALKAVWQYVKAHKLQDPRDGRIINCDEKMKAVYQRDVIEAKMLYSLISFHILTTTDREKFTSQLDDYHKRFKAAGDKHQARLDVLLEAVKK